MDEPARKKTIGGIILIGFAVLLVFQIIAFVPLWTRNNPSAHLNIVVPGRYKVGASAYFYEYGQPAVSGEVQFVDDATGAMHSVSYYLYSDSRYMETVQGGDAIWLPAGNYHVTNTGGAMIEVFTIGPFNFSGSGGREGEGWSAVVTAIIGVIILCAIIKLAGPFRGGVRYGRTSYYSPARAYAPRPSVTIPQLVGDYISNLEMKGITSFTLSSITRDLGLPDIFSGMVQPVLDEMVASGRLEMIGVSYVIK